MNERVKSYKKWKHVKCCISDFDGVNKGAVSIRILPASGVFILPSMDNALANPEEVHVSVLDNTASREIVLATGKIDIVVPQQNISLKLLKINIRTLLPANNIVINISRNSHSSVTVDN